MADYTYLNNVPACRIHKCNAQAIKEECEEMLKYYRDKLLILTASAPHTVDEGDGPITWEFYVQREISNLWDEILEHSHRLFLAEYIIDNPNDCDDELEDINYG